jgi:predicted Zn-dependent protease
LGREFELGHTERNVTDVWIRQATITLLTEPEIDRHLPPLRQKQRLYSTLLHELGHALGLEHTESKRDVMHHQGWRNLCLSLNDAHQIQALYAKNQGFNL